MKFDIARKVVKFQNGQFGIRRWTLVGYQFLGMDKAKDFWWGSIEEFVAKYAVGTEEQARERLRLYLSEKPAKAFTPGYDKGRPA